MDSSGMLKERCYGSDGMASETVEHMFLYGGNTHGLAWCMYRIMPLYKGKDDKCECCNSRDISLSSVVGKQYGRVLIERVRAGTVCAVG